MMVGGVGTLWKKKKKIKSVIVHKLRVDGLQERRGVS